MKLNMVNVNGMDHGGWTEWDGLWTGGNKIKHEQ